MDSDAYLLESTGAQTPIEEEVTIGRAPGVTLWLDDPAVSRRHATVRRTAAGFEIEDLHSANGTYVNDELIAQPTILRPGDRITIGTNDLTFSAPEAATPRSVSLDAPGVAWDLDTDPAAVLPADLALDDENTPTLFSPVPDDFAPSEARTVVSPVYEGEAPIDSAAAQDTPIDLQTFPVWEEEIGHPSEAATVISQPDAFLQTAIDAGVADHDATVFASPSEESTQIEEAATLVPRTEQVPTLLDPETLGDVPPPFEPSELEPLERTKVFGGENEVTEQFVAPPSPEQARVTPDLGPVVAPIPTEPVAVPFTERSMPLVTAPNPLQVAARLGQRTRDGGDLRQILEDVVQQLSAEYHVRAAAFFLADEAGERMQCAIAAGDAADVFAGETDAWGEGPAGRAAAENRAQVVSRSGQDADTLALASSVDSVLVAPIEVRGGRIVSVLALLDPLWKPAFGEDDLDFASLLVQQLAVSWPEASTWTDLARQLEPDVRSLSVRRRFITHDRALRDAAARCMELVGAGSPVYLWGETGSGREHLARTAAQLAGGDGAPFVAVTGLQPADADISELLFGGNDSAWARASGGMLYITDAGTLDHTVIEAIAGRLSAGDPVRIAFSGTTDPAMGGLAALAEFVGLGVFHLPPLRERRDDIPLLAQNLVLAGTERYGGSFVGFDEGARLRLQEYDWPGNGDELASLALQFVVFSEEPRAGIDALARLAPDTFGGSSGPDMDRWDGARRMVADLLSQDRTVQDTTIPKVRQLPADELTVVLGGLLRAVESAAGGAERARGLDLLARAGDGRVARYIATYLNDPDPWVQASAIVAFGQTPPTDAAIAALNQTVSGENPVTAALAVLALGRIRDRSALGTFQGVLSEGGDWKVRAAVAAALTNYDPAMPDVRSALERSMQRAEWLPSRSVRQARGAGVLTADDLRRMFTAAGLPAESKVRLLQLVGQGDEAGLLDLLADLAFLPLEEVVQQALAEQLARRGETSLPVLLRLIGSSSPTAQAVGLGAVRQLSSPVQLVAALRHLGANPSLLQALKEGLAGHPQAFESTVLDHVYADWRLESLLQMLRVLAAAHGEDLPVPQPS